MEHNQQSAAPSPLESGEVLLQGSPEATPPIVGIGASAGGLEALREFLGSVPQASGIGFVVVQHQDPASKSMLRELLQHSTSMTVVHAGDGVKILPDHVYITPASYEISVLHGVLHLLESISPDVRHHPIDGFFRALAADQRDRSIGVILSGTGSDGTLGLRSIKECAGTSFVQSPQSAKFDGMPRSAIEAELADVVAPAAELASKIAAFVKALPRMTPSTELGVSESDQNGLDKVILLLRAQTGNDFSHYKKNTLFRRIERRMTLHLIGNIADYVRYLQNNPQELDLLFKELLIGVTSFFRDPEVWEQLKTDLIPELLALHPNGANLRAWVPACSTGEEAYSLAIIFLEALEHFRPTVPYSLQIFATDLDVDAINQARVGMYLPNISADVSAARLGRYFTSDERGYRISKRIREMVIFAPHNLIMDPPFTRLNIVCCRNLLIYLDTQLQRKIFPLFQHSLQTGGVMVLGTSETISSADAMFEVVPGKNRIYRRRTAVLRTEMDQLPAVFSSRPVAGVAGVAGEHRRGSDVPSNLNVQALTDSLLLQKFSPAAVLCTARGDLVYISGKTGKYLEPAAGKANLNLFSMARDELAGALQEAFSRALRQEEAVKIKSIAVGSAVVAITVQAIAEPSALTGMVLVVFSEQETATAQSKAQGRQHPKNNSNQHLTALNSELAQSLEELVHTREELKIAREEMQTSQEELKSTNEELQSTNEELQSTNEELTSSKEEMQSMNEEMQTVNHELHSKLGDFSRSNDDMKNLLNSTEIATLFLDSGLRIRSFTDRTTSIIKLIPSDTGRAITDLVSTLEYDRLADDAHEVLRTLVTQEKQIRSINGQWFTVRTMPYRTQNNLIDGVVITFIDYTAAKIIESTAREALAALEMGTAYLSDEHGAESEQRRVRELETAINKAKTMLHAQLKL
jgi:two-component system CheB/CheR fusion protein